MIQPVFLADSGEEDVFARLELFDGPVMLAVADSPRLPDAKPARREACP